MTPLRLVIIGGGAGGMAAATQARRTAPSLEIVVLEQTEHVSVGRCSLPYFIGGQVPDYRALIAHTPDYFRSRRNIDVRTRHQVEQVLPHHRTITGRDLSTGERFELRYDRLVFATGAAPVPLSIPGFGLPHVFTVRTLEDAIRLRALLEQRTARRAVIIGGGFIGLEMAEALHRWQLEITVLEAGDRVLPAFDPWVSALAANELDAHGIKVRTGVRVTAIETGAVHTSDGPVAADVVIVAVGQRPNVTLLKAAEAGRSGALAVSKNMQTSLPATFAAGDCAEHRSAVTNRPVHAPLGSVANLQGRIAGEAAAGKITEAPPLAGTYQLQLFDLTLARTGLSEAEAERYGYLPVSAAVAGHTHAPALPGAGEFEIRLTADARTGRLLGAQLAGHRDAARRIDTVAALLVGGASAAAAAGLDLGYTPPLSVARDPLVGAAQRLLTLMDRTARR